MLKWFQSAKKKCDRLGHNKVTRKYRAYTRKTNYRGVVGSGSVTLVVCKRCGEVFGEPKIVVDDDITSFSAPQNVWNDIRERGFHLRELMKETDGTTMWNNE